MSVTGYVRVTLRTLDRERKNMSSDTIYTARACKKCGAPLSGRKDKLFCNQGCKREYRKRPWRNFKKDTCEKCGFVPVHKCQLDVDHINGDKKNNSPDNLRTLCANCHRLKTHLNSEHLNTYK